VQFTADYYEIEIEDAIENLTAQQVFRQCFNLDGFSNPNYDPGLLQCQQISRTANGFDLNPINQPILNLGGIRTSGVDLATNVSVPIEAIAWGGGDGRVTFRSLVNILTGYEIQSFAGNPFADFAGTITGTEAFPELKMLNTVSVETGPIDFTFAWRHIGEMDDIAAQANTGSIAEIDAFNYFDLTARYDFNKRFEIYGGVSNLNDEGPPQIGGPPGGRVNSDTNQGVYDAIGRTFFIGARARF
jgi:outer membrane receptor protein involved in Fe transport